MKLDLSSDPGIGGSRDAAVERLAPTVTSPFATFSSLLAGLRRRCRLWAATGVAGMIASLAFSLAFPPEHAATTIMLLRHSSSGDTSQAMTTAAELLKTRTVAQRVIRRMDLDISAKALISTYQVEALSTEILQLRVTGPTPDDAARRANAVAEEFLRFRREELERQTRVVVATLEERQAELTSELATVNETINRSPSGGGDTAVRQLGDLLTRRAVLEDQIGQLRERIDEALADPTSMGEQSRVVDPASNDDRAPVKAIAVNLAAGLIGGLGAGGAWVVVAEILGSDRARRREEVAAALDVPVAVSTGLFGSLRAQRRRFRRQGAHPEPEVSRVVHHLRRCLSARRAMTPALVVLSVDADGPAALAVASTAMELLNEGKNVLVADLSRTSALAHVFHVAKGKTSTLHPRKTDSKLWVAFLRLEPLAGLNDRRRQGDVPELRDQADVVLALATVDPAVGAWHLLEWGTSAVAVVRAGHSTATRLRSAAQMIRAAGIDLDSAVLVGAQTDDESVGLPGVPTGSSSGDGAAVRPNP